MNRLLTAFCFCFLPFLIAAQNTLRFDSSGNVTELPLLPAGAQSNFNLPIAVDTPGSQLDALRQALLEKMRRTKANLIEPDYSFRRFYDSLWGPTVVEAIINELDQQIAYLNAPAAQSFSYQYLPATTYFDPIFLNWTAADYYTFNKDPYRPYLPLSPADYDKANHAYKVNVYYKDPYKDFIIRLYNHSIAQADVHDLPAMSNTEFYRTLPAELETLKKTAVALSAIPLASYTDQTKDSIDSLHAALLANKLYHLVQTSNYFKNWLWLTEGELTLNPLEVKGADSTGRRGNVSLVVPIAQSTSLLNTVLVPVKQAHKRYVVYSAQPLLTAPDNATPLKGPFTSEDEAAVVVNNIRTTETVRLQQTQSEAIKDQNAFMSGLDATAGLIGQLNPIAGIWNKIFTDINPLPKALRSTGTENLYNQLSDAYSNSKQSVVAARNRQAVLNAIKSDLDRYHAYNPILFRRTLTLLENLPDFHANQVNREDVKLAFVANFLDQYETLFQELVRAKERLQTDSLLSANLYTLLTRSNPPPAPITPSLEARIPQYRTEIFMSGTVDASVHRFFSVNKYLMSGGRVVDSSRIGSFDYKVGRRYLFLTSAGIAYTFPTKYYGQNTITTATDGTIKVETRAEIIRFVAGLHIYPGKIFLQDDKVFGSKAHPWYTRLSLFAGLGIPKPLENYYPGLSYDIIPGLKLVAGTHLYRYNRYQVANNVITQQTAAIKLAGAFVSLNVDPVVVISAWGFSK